MGALSHIPEPGTAAWHQLCCQHKHVVHAVPAGAAAALWVNFQLHQTRDVLHLLAAAPGARPQFIPPAPLPPTLLCLLCRPGAPQCASVLLFLTFPLGTFTSFWHPVYTAVPPCRTNTSWLQGQTQARLPSARISSPVLSKVSALMEVLSSFCCPQVPHGRILMSATVTAETTAPCLSLRDLEEEISLLWHEFAQESLWGPSPL